MKCPNCRLENQETEAECKRCGLIFAKWRAASSGVGPTPSAPREAAADAAPVALETLLLFALFLSVAGWYFIHGRRPAAEARAETAAEVQTMGAGAASGGVENPCLLEGEVLDIYRLRPVIGSRVFFRPKFAGITDGRGRYEVRVTAGSGYAAEFAHGDYQPNFVAGFARNWREAPWDQRVRAARTVLLELERGEGPSKAADFSCEPGRRGTFNFALIPKDVTDEERERISAVR